MARAALCVAVASTGLVVAAAASPSVAAAETRGVHISVGSRAAENRWNWSPAENQNHAKCAAAEVCHNLRMELSGFGPPPYEVTCSALGKTETFTWRSGRESANCYFWGSGFAVVAWVDGVRSNDLWWEPAAPAAVEAPPPAAPAAAETRGVHISVGSRAAENRWNWSPAENQNHAKCAAAEVCHNLRMELSGFGPPPYEVTCSALGKTETFTWRSGRESANCYFWGSGFAVVAWVDGVRSNDLWWEPAAPAAVEAPPPEPPEWEVVGFQLGWFRFCADMDDAPDVAYQVTTQHPGLVASLVHTLQKGAFTNWPGVPYKATYLCTGALYHLEGRTVIAAGWPDAMPPQVTLVPSFLVPGSGDYLSAETLASEHEEQQREHEELLRCLQWHQLGLDAAGLTPGVGIVADGAAVVAYLQEECYRDAALSAVGAIPLIGLLSGGGKVGAKAARLADLVNSLKLLKLTPHDINKIRNAVVSNSWPKLSHAERAERIYGAAGLKVPRNIVVRLAMGNDANRAFSKFDHLSRPVQFGGTLTEVPVKAARDRAFGRSVVEHFGEKNHTGGHLWGALLGGPGNTLANIVPQSEKMNGAINSDFERLAYPAMKEALTEFPGSKFHLLGDVKYPGDSFTPSSIEYTAWIENAAGRRTWTLTEKVKQ